VGSILGTVIAYFTYRQFYPSLASEQSHRPYSPRIAREEADTLPLHHHQPPSPGHDDPLHPQTEGYRDPFTASRPMSSELHPDGHEGYMEHGYELESNVRQPTPGMGKANM
jgi:diacylglycerol diphosphate phosphatase / phosphatidate phosphatase